MVIAEDSAAVRSEWAELPVRLGACRRLALLGRGEMSAVYAAELVEERPYGTVGSRVAVKVLRPSLAGNPVQRERFRREGEIGTTIDHPVIVRAFESGALAVGAYTFCFLVQEQVVGTTLAELMTRLGRVPEALLCDLAGQLAAGLQALHDRGVIHRDLKPANVLLADGDRVRLADLGIARELGPGLPLTRSGDFVGTPKYAAPEQFEAAAVGPAADLYALGVVLYEAATGSPPLAAANVRELLRRKLLETPRRAAEVNPQLSPLFDEVVATLLARDPAARFRSAAELATALAGREESRWWRARQRARRSGPRRDIPVRVQVARDSPFTGRRRELERLLACAHAAKEGTGACVLVVGEAGAGKTRLVDELLARLQSEPQPMTVLYGASAPDARHGAGVVAEALRAYLGAPRLPERDTASSARRTMPAPAVLAYLTGEPAADDGERRSPEQLASALVGFAAELANANPTLWVLEDLHLASDDELLLLRRLTRLSRTRRLLLLATVRPGFSPATVARLARAGDQVTVELGRLARDDMRRIVRAGFGAAAAAAELVEAVCERADGNPFFAIELVRHIRASPSPTELRDLPWSVRSLLAERLSPLTDDDRAVLETAAVQGLEFDGDRVARVLDRSRLDTLRALARLERSHGLVRGTGRRHRFDHQLLREYLYDELPQPLRVEYHRRFAAVYAEPGHDGGTVAAFRLVSLVAHALRGADEPRVRAHILAALRHLEQRYRHHAVVELSQLALDLLSPRRAHDDRAASGGAAAADTTATRLLIDIYRARATAFDFLSRRSEQEQAVERGSALAAGIGDVEREVELLISRGYLHSRRGEYRAAIEVLRRAERTAAEHGFERLRGEVLSGLGLALTRTGATEAALACQRRHVAIALRLDDRQQETAARLNIATELTVRGELDHARAELERAYELARAAGRQHYIGLAVGNLGFLDASTGDYQRAARRQEEALANRCAAGDRRGEALAKMNLGTVLSHLGDMPRALAYHDEAALLARELESPHLEAGCQLGRLLHTVYSGDLEAASALERQTAASETSSTPQLRAEFLLLRAHLLVAKRMPGPARALADEAAAIFADIGYQIGHTEALRLGGVACLAAGDRDAAARAFEPTAAAATMLGLMHLAASARAHLSALDRSYRDDLSPPPTGSFEMRAETHLALYRAGRGRHHLDAARALVEPVARSLGDDAARFWEGNPVAAAIRAQR